MKTIYKYPLAVMDLQSVALPQGAEILTVQDQQGQLCLWALVDPDRSLQERTIVIHGTGHTVYESRLEYIATVQQAQGSLVWHVFEVLP